MDFNLYFWIIFLAVVGLHTLDLISQILNINALKGDCPGEFAGVFDPEAYRKSQDYTRESTRFGILESTFGLAIFLLFWLLGGFPWLDGLVRSWSGSDLVRGILFVGVLFLGNQLLDLPFEIYSTFVIEERYGFNKTTPKTFVVDHLKGLLLTALLGVPVLALILWLFARWELAWLYAFLAVSAFSLILSYVAPKWIMPLFNKFSPMEEGELKSAIHDLAGKCKFPLAEVSVMDGSRRSSKSNAFFTGFGKNKKIALFDTLIAKHPVAELVAVLAHEIGHYRKKHIIQAMVLGFIQMGITFYLLSVFLNNESLFRAFGLRETSIYLSLILFGLLFQPINRILSVGLALWSRKNEFEADAYAAEVTGSPEELVSALKKLSRDNLSNLTPHPFYVFLNYSHPPVLQRIQALRSE